MSEELEKVEGERNDLAVYDEGFKQGKEEAGIEIDKLKQEIENLKLNFQEKIALLIKRIPRFERLIVGIFAEELQEGEEEDGV